MPEFSIDPARGVGFFILKDAVAAAYVTGVLAAIKPATGRYRQAQKTSADRSNIEEDILRCADAASTLGDEDEVVSPGASEWVHCRPGCPAMTLCCLRFRGCVRQRVLQLACDSVPCAPLAPHLPRLALSDISPAHCSRTLNECSRDRRMGTIPQRSWPQTRTTGRGTPSSRGYTPQTHAKGRRTHHGKRRRSDHSPRHLHFPRLATNTEPITSRGPAR